MKKAKADTLKSYIAVKDEKESLKSKINALKGLLENAPAASKETLSELTKMVKEGGFMDNVAAVRREGPEDIGFLLYEIFSRSKDRMSLDLNLLARNFSCDPVFHSNGGVADFKVIYKGEKFLASGFFKPALLVSLLNKWERCTGQRPAYKITALQEAKERIFQAEQQKQSKGFKMKMR